MIHPDCYGYRDGYMYDVQRTMIIGAEPTPAQRVLMNGSWEQAQLLGHALRDGVTCREIHELGLRFMAERGRSDEEIAQWRAGHFGHGYASGFDWPWLGAPGPLADEPLKAPFAVTIELFWHDPGVGSAWVEDNWLIMPDRGELLSASLPPPGRVD